jgi:tRNA threonylcarbamoyladenosine biosynthesis protein TsaB
VLVLGIETSTPQASVAIGSEQGVVASALVSRGATHAEFLLPAIRFCLDQTGLGFRNIGGMAVSLGPGLYTGMRVGVATAKAMAQALSVPIVSMSSLDLLAYDVRYSPKTICAVLDARRNEVFHAFYRSSPGGIQRMTDYRIERPEQLAVGIDSRPEEVLLVGSGALVNKEAFQDVPVAELGTMSHAFPDARPLVELALPRLFREEFDALDDVKPLYLRRSAQPIRWERIRERKPSLGET